MFALIAAPRLCLACRGRVDFPVSIFHFLHPRGRVRGPHSVFQLLGGEQVGGWRLRLGKLAGPCPELKSPMLQKSRRWLKVTSYSHPWAAGNGSLWPTLILSSYSGYRQREKGGPRVCGWRATPVGRSKAISAKLRRLMMSSLQKESSSKELGQFREDSGTVA